MNQLICIHGGETFDTYEEFLDAFSSWTYDPMRSLERNWKDTLSEKLGDTWEVLQPAMPNKQNAHYNEWRMWFEKVLAYAKDDVICAGHSLGGVFLAKFLSEEVAPVRIKASILIAAPFFEKEKEYSLADFSLPESLVSFTRQGGAIHLLHSEDDPVVPYKNARAYKEALLGAHLHTFKDRGHFRQENFPELIRLIKSI